MLKDKNIILGVSGSIACYKAAYLASLLKKSGCKTFVLMTKNASRFVSPLTFEALTGRKVCCEMFGGEWEGKIRHITLSGEADAIIIAPATANIIAKIANGICDDMLTSTALACECKKIIAPSMNTRMYNNPVTRENIKKLKGLGWMATEPGTGLLACGDTGEGKLPSPEKLFETLSFCISHEKDMAGLKVAVTAGPTIETIDPVRYITNRSTGKMGFALASAAAARGAETTLITGPVDLPDPSFMKVLHVESAKEMFDAVTTLSGGQDIIVKAAAVADFTPENVADEKIKKDSAGEICLKLKKTDDILAYLGKNKKHGQLICGFSMETENLIENSKRKLEQKNLDMIAANNLRDEGAGFGAETNLLTLITADSVTPLGLMTKAEAADVIFDSLIKMRKQGKIR